MGSGEITELVFVCPECNESLEVNASMKETLVERGCVICGGSVSEAAFTPVSPDSS